MAFDPPIREEILIMTESHGGTLRPVAAVSYRDVDLPVLATELGRDEQELRAQLVADGVVTYRSAANVERVPRVVADRLRRAAGLPTPA
jgi:hypothetical protein